MNEGAGRTEKLRQLMRFFQVGDLAGAEEVARQLIAADGKDSEAQHLLAQIVFKEGRAQEAVDLMRLALELDPTRAAWNNDYGVMLTTIGRWDEAAAAYGMAAVLDSSNIDARFNLALALFRSGQKERARIELDRVLALNPDLPDALALEGELRHADNEPERAAEAFGKAIERGLNTPELHVKRASALKDAGRDDEAREALQEAERIGGDDADTLFHLGDFHQQKGDKAQAERFFRRAIARRPDFAEAHNNLWKLLHDRGETAEGMMCLVNALAIDPKDVSAYINLGRLNVRAGSLGVAVFILQRATQIDPRSHDAWNILGSALMYLNRIQEAEEAFHRAIALHPGSDSEFNLALLLLRCGRFTEGWPLYERRWQTVDKEKRLPLKQPEWDGEVLGQRTILVYHEQGFGDSLQFVRYLALLRERHPHAKISFLCPLPLGRLFVPLAAAWGIDLSRFGADNLPPYDVHVALMSLPWRMGTTLETIPATIPYLVPPLEVVQKWAPRLAPLSSSRGRKVGLVWSGGDTFQFQNFRSLRLEELLPLLGIDGIHWVSLQKGKPAEEIAEGSWSGRIFDLMNEVEDFADTAAIVEHLDLVISVDTSVAHLAGAMGKPVWLLNRFSTDWRWLLDREDSPWYPTMRIFRQPSFGDWEAVIQNVAEALRERVSCAP